MESLGSRLRREREAQSLTMEDVAQRTRIKISYLEAIERDDSSGLPGGFFYRSFVRQYARALELPDNFGEAELEALIREEEAIERERNAAPKEREYRVPPVPMEGVVPSTETRKWIVGVSVLASVLVVCSIAYALWERYRSRAVEGAETTIQTAAKPVETPAPAPAATTTFPPEEGVGAGSTAAAEPSPATPAQEQEPKPAETAAPPTEVATQSPAPAVSGAVRVSLRATEDVWVEATSGGRRLYSGTMKAGTSTAVASDRPIRVKLGSAGAMEIEHNGALIPAAGPRGVVRTLTFRQDGYEGGTDAPNR
jgi:cytoskeletal protein RodZ